MGNNLSDRIAKMQSQKRVRRGGTNHAVFLALREEIAKAIEDGWPIKSIWQTLHEENKIKITYDAFRRNVRRYITSNRTQEEGEAGQNNPEKSNSKEQAKEPIKAKSTGEGFSFNPKPTQEDLI